MTIPDAEVDNAGIGPWEDRLRRVGDARFDEVRWSLRDNPSYRLPTKKYAMPYIGIITDSTALKTD
jgi:hypothetical protein